MRYDLGLLASIITLLTAITLAVGALALLAHSWSRSRARSFANRSRALARELARFLTCELDEHQLRGIGATAPGRVFWSAVEAFADNITGPDWARLCRVLRLLPEVECERRRLADRRPWRRALAARHLGMLRDASMRDPLRAALVRGPLTVRLSAALALARLRDRGALHWLLRHPAATEELGPRVLTAVIKRFGRSSAAVARTSLGSPAPESAIRLAAIEILGVWGDRRGRTTLENLVAFGEQETRVAAARALGALGDRASIPNLLAALADPAWPVRAQAARALGAIRGPESLEALRIAMEDRNWWVRRNAGYALASHGETGIDLLHRLAQLGSDAFARSMAIEVLQASAWNELRPGGISRVA